MAVITTRKRSFRWAVITILLATTALMNYPVTVGQSAVRPPSPVGGARSSLSTADDSGPLSITPALDGDRAASATITSDGGTLTATAANGTIFTLAIPPGALVDTETITMVPAGSIPDLPLSGGLAGGGAVQLGPDGLILLKAATLVIQPSSPLSIDQQSPFAWHASGEDFHLFPLTLDPATLTMELIHFSGYGAGSGTSGDRAAARAHSSASEQSQLEQQVQKSAEDARQKLSQNPTKKQQKKAEKKYKNDVANYYEDLFESLLESLKQDLSPLNEAGLRCRLSHLLESLKDLHEKGHLGLENLVVDLAPTVTKAVQTLVDKASERCADDIREVANLLGLAKFAERLGAADSALSGVSSIAKTARDAVIKCARLTLYFFSRVNFSAPTGTGPPFTIGIVLAARNGDAGSVHLTPTIDTDGTIKFKGQAPLKHEDPALSVPDCSSNLSGSAESTLNVISFEFTLKMREVNCDSPDANWPSDFKAVIDVGEPYEHIVAQCPNGVGASVQGDVWRAQFYCRYQAVAQSGSQFTITDWDLVGTGSKDTLCDWKDSGSSGCRFDQFNHMKVTRDQ
jgi:hypothetical protein